MLMFMTHLQALILGIVQGLTEFLPVSSSTHLALAKKLMGIEGTFHFDLICHLGTLSALFFIFWKDIFRVLREARSIALFAVALLPLIPAYFLLKPLRMYLATDAGFFLLATSALLFLASSKRFTLEKVPSKPIPPSAANLDLDPRQSSRDSTIASDLVLETQGHLRSLNPGAFTRSKFQVCGRERYKWRDVLCIGIAQSLALFPGMSRSGSTIAAARLLGWEWGQAVRFSFLLAVPTILGGAMLEALRGFDGGSLAAGLSAIGFAASFVTGLGSLKLLLWIIQRGTLRPFAWYCLAAGIFALLLLK